MLTRWSLDGLESEDERKQRVVKGSDEANSDQVRPADGSFGGSRSSSVPVRVSREYRQLERISLRG